MTRREFDLENETVDFHGSIYAVFLGGCFGVALTARGENDPHVCFEIFCEDDGHWFPTTSNFSSWWLDNICEVLNCAKEFIKENCINNGHGEYFFTEAQLNNPVRYHQA